MDLTKEAIEKIENMANAVPKTVEIGGETYSTRDLKLIARDPQPSALTFGSLSGVVDYIKKNLDGVKPEECAIHIEGPEDLTVYGPVGGPYKKRYEIVTADMNRGGGMKAYSFGDWNTQEAFIISLLTMFESTQDLETIKTAATCMVARDDEETQDNGAGQKRTRRDEVILNGDIPPGVVRLKPFRTFRQVDQPESAFIFRYAKFGGEVKLALFEADGGAWKHEAVTRIYSFLSAALPDTPIFT